MADAEVRLSVLAGGVESMTAIQILRLQRCSRAAMAILVCGAIATPHESDAQNFNLSAVVIDADWMSQPRVIANDTEARCIWGLLYSLRGSRVIPADRLPNDRVIVLTFFTPTDWQSVSGRPPEQHIAHGGSGRVMLFLDRAGGPPQLDYQRAHRSYSFRYHMRADVEPAVGVFGIATRLTPEGIPQTRQDSGYTRAVLPCSLTS